MQPSIKPMSLPDLAAGVELRDCCLGTLASLRHLYSPREPWHAYLECKPVYLTAHCREHIKREHPERAALISQCMPLLPGVVEAPDLVCRSPHYANIIGHWIVTVAKSISAHPGFIVVVISLARMAPEDESAFHQVVTVHPAKDRFFYEGDLRREPVLKERWLPYKQKTGSKAGHL